MSKGRGSGHGAGVGSRTFSGKGGTGKRLYQGHNYQPAGILTENLLSDEDLRRLSDAGVGNE